MTLLEFRVKGGATTQFNAYVCSLFREGQKFFLFQLFFASAPRVIEPAPAFESEEKALHKFKSGDTDLRTGAFSFEANAARNRNSIARCNWPARSRWISTTRSPAFWATPRSS